MLQIPSVWAFVHQAVSTDVLVVDVDAAMAELEGAVANPAFGLFLATNGKEWGACALAYWSYSAFNSACIVIHFYSRGDPATRGALLVRIAEFAREGGFSRIISADTNERPDAFMRLFRSVGEPIKVGSTVVFELEG